MIVNSQRDFGEVWQQRTFHWSFTLANESDQKIEIADWVTGCTCTSVEPRSLILQPHSKQDLTLTIDLMPRNAADAAAEVREFKTSIAPKVKKPLLTHGGWQFSGRVRSFVEGAPRFVLREPLIHRRTVGPHIFNVRFRVPLRSLKVEGDKRVISSFETAPLNRDQTEFAITIRPNDDLKIGPIESSVVLSAVDRTGLQLPRIDVPLDGQVVNNVYALPDRIAFGLLRTGESAQQCIVISSRSGSPFTLEEGDVLSLPDSPAQIAPEPVDVPAEFEIKATRTEPQRCLLNVRARCAASGPRSRRFAYTVREVGVDPYIIECYATYIGSAKTPIQASQ